MWELTDRRIWLMPPEPWSGLCCPAGLVAIPQPWLSSPASPIPGGKKKLSSEGRDCKIPTDVSAIKYQILLQPAVGLNFPLRKFLNNIFIVSLRLLSEASLPPPCHQLEKISFLNIWIARSVFPKKMKVRARGTHFVGDPLWIWTDFLWFVIRPWKVAACGGRESASSWWE